MNDGWLKLYRKITEWEWYNHSQMVHLFLHLVIKASSTDKVWQGIKVCRGQAIVSRPKLCAETGISERTIRTCLQRLVSSGEIQIKTTSKYSIITICKYGDYQPIGQQGDQQGDQPNDQQSDLQNGHIYRSKEEKNIIPDNDKFIFTLMALEMLYPHVNFYFRRDEEIFTNVINSIDFPNYVGVGIREILSDSDNKPYLGEILEPILKDLSSEDLIIYKDDKNIIRERTIRYGSNT